MSAATAPNPKSGEAKAHEPSMEEILASIRRIIADDQALPLTPRPSVNLRPVAAESPPLAESPRRAARSPESDEAEFLSQLAVTLPSAKAPPAPPAPPPVAQAEPMAQASDRDQSAREFWPAVSRQADNEPIAPAPEIEAEPAASPSAYEREEQAPAAAPTPLTPSTVAAMPAAVALREDKLLSPSTDASVASSFNVLATTMFIQNSGTIEQTVREMLRPMLQRWLDDNLPTMVERLVRAEIERVARGGRG